MAQVRAGIQRKQHSPLLLDRVADHDAPAVHTVEVEIEVGAGPHFTAKVERMGEAPRTEILAFVQQVVTAIDGPVIPGSENRAVSRTMAGVGRHEPAFTWVLLERFLKRRRLK